MPNSKHWRVFGASMLLMNDVYGACNGAWYVNSGVDDHASSVTHVVCGSSIAICTTVWTALSGGGGGGCAGNDDEYYYDPGSDEWYKFSSTLTSHNNVLGKLGLQNVFLESTAGISCTGTSSGWDYVDYAQNQNTFDTDPNVASGEVFKMRSTRTSTDGVYEDFSTITFLNGCYDDVLSISGGSQNIDVVAGTLKQFSSGTVAHNHNGTPIGNDNCGGCPLTQLLEIYDPSINEWTSSTSNSFWTSVFTVSQTNNINCSGTNSINVQASSTTFTATSTQVRIRCTQTSNYSKQFSDRAGSFLGLSRTVQDEMQLTIYKSGTNLNCIGQAYTTNVSTTLSDFSYDVYANSASVSKTWNISKPGCNPNQNWSSLDTLDASGNWVAETFPWSSMSPQSITNSATTATFTVQEQTQSNLYPLLSKQVAFKLSVSASTFSSITLEKTWIVTLNQGCATNVFSLTSAQHQADIYYLPLATPTTQTVAAFSYTSTKTVAQCPRTVLKMQVKNKLDGDWLDYNSVSDVWVKPTTFVTSTLAFDIKASTSQVAYGDQVYVRRIVSDQYSGSSVEDLFTIYWISTCMSNTLSLLASDVTSQTAVVGTSMIIASKLNTVTAGSCPYTATCQIFDSNKAAWVDATTFNAGITCSSTGAWTVNISSTSTVFDPSTILLAQVIYTSTESLVATTSNPSKQVIDQFYLTIQSKCLATTITYPDFADITHQLTSTTNSVNYSSPGFATTGSNNSVCPNTVKLELREDGSAQNWATWSGGSFTSKASSPVTYTFIQSLTTTGALNGLGGFTISTTGRLFTPSKKFNARLTLTGNGSGKVVEVLFNITLVDTCSVNTFTISQPATVDYVIALSGTTAAISKTTSTVTGATTGCTLNYTLEVYDSALFAWVQVTTANVASKYTFLQYTSSTTTNAFSVQTTNFSTWGNTSTLLRQRVQDPNSLQVGGNVTSQLVVNISYVCSSDTLSITSANNIPDQLYYFGTANQNLQLPVVAQTQAGCPKTYLLQVYDESKHLWVDFSSASHGYFVKTFSTTTGQISIENLTGTKSITGDLLPSVQIGMKIVATSTSSTSLTLQSVIDEFTLKLASSACLDNILTKTSELPDVVYTVFAAATSQTITPLYSTLKPTATCALTAKLYVLDDAANTWKDNALAPLSFITFNAASTASGAFSIQQTTRATYAPSTKFELKVRISDLNSNQQVLEFQFTLELRDQCADDILTLSSQIASYSYQIGSGDSTVNMMKPSFTHLYTGCQLDANLYFLDTNTGLYLNDNTGSTVSGSPYEFVKTFTALGELTINTSNNSKYGLKSDFLVKITLSLPQSSPSKSISYQFTITILNKCQNNSLMFTIANAQSNLKYYINSNFDGNAANTPDTTLTPTVTSTESAATCPLQATLEVWNNSKHLWQTQTVSGWVKTFNTSTGALVISTTDFVTYHPMTSPTFTDAWTTVDVRITLKDVNSNNVSNSASEIFTLQILRECSDVSITKGANIPAVTYFVNSGASTAIVPSFTIGQSGCKPDFRLWFFDDQSGEWSNTFPTAVSSFDLTTGRLILNTSNFSVYNKPVVYQTKITAFNTVSSISFQFNITVKDKCYDNKVITPIILKNASTNQQHTEVDPFVWDLWQYTTAKITDPVVSIPGLLCPTTFQITDIDTERTQIPVSTLKIVGATPTQTVEGVYRDTTKIGARYFYVRATIKNMNNDQVILTTETKYFVNFKNPCTKITSIIESPIPDIDYWIKDIAATQNVADYDDQASADYGGIVRSDTNFSTTAKLCGPKSYSLYKMDPIQNILVVSSPFISLAQVGGILTITVQTNDPQYYTNSFVNYLVKVSLDDYEVSNPRETIWWEPVKVQLKNCQVTSMTYPIVSDVDYNLYTPVIHIQMTQFTQVHQAPFSKSAGQQCSYTLTYTAKWLDFYGTIIDLPSFITWNAAQFRFEVQSSNLIDLTTLRQTYKLLLIASVSITDMSPVFSQTQQFTLNVKNGCLLDISTVATSISDYVYYINENTEFGTWTQGVLPKPKVHTFTTTYTQSVAGCPVDYNLYRTYADGSRKLITAYEKNVLSYTYPTINVTTLWASQSSLLPFTVVVTLTTDKYDYDLQEWNLNVVQASTYSTAASREASTNFKLTIKDVCWDLPLSGMTIASVPVSQDIWEVFKLSYTSLTTQWGDYCDGESYTMQYVSGPKVQGLITANQVNMMLVYSSVTKHNSALPGVPYMTATINDRSWIGNHVVKIVGQIGLTRKYKTYTTADFTLKIVDPCERSVVSAQAITDMVFTIGPTQVSTKQYYNEFGDSMGLLYGDQYSKCGPRIHKLTQVGWLNYMTPSGSQLLQFLGFESYPNGNPTLAFPSTPNAYGIFVNTENTDYLGQRSMQLTVSLLNYPAATSAVVNFKIRIDPCVVTSYTAPASMTISFTIGQTPMNAIFNFVQGSCSYPATYGAQLQSGQALPTFFSQNSRANYFNIRASNLANVGQYVVQINGTLDNILVQSSTTNTYLLPAQQVNASSPPAGYIYTNSFLLTINIYATSPGTQTNPNPFFSPVPYDTWVYVGDKFTQTYGKAVDTANHVINVTVELGDAARFLSFDSTTNSISIQALKTTAADVNSYKLRITLATDQLTPVLTTYDFVLAIREKPNNLSKDQVLTDQRLTEVFNKYDNNVIDLRGFNQAEIYSNQYASQYLPTLQTTTVPVGGSSQQLRLTTYTAVTPDNMTKSPPQPFIKSISPDSILTIGFDQLMNVPTNLIELLKKQVAIRWLESTTETYLTPDGYRDFEIRPSLDIQVIPSPDSDPIKLGFNFDLVSFDNNELKVKLNFQLPEYVSSQGISKDQVMVTFWDNKSLTAVNGLPVPEGTTLTKPVVRLILDSLVANIDKISKQCAIAAVIIIVIGLLITLLFDFDEAPFWSLFNTWQIISHLPLLNLNYSGFLTTFLRKQLDFMLLRIPSWQRLVIKTSKISMIDERSFSDAFETSGYASMLLTINLSMPLALIAVLIICLPLSWLIDKVVSVRDPLSRFGGRKQIFRKPLFSKTVNALLRCLMIVFLDLSICMLLNIFSWKQNYQVNAFGKLNACIVIISSCVIGLLFAFIWGQAIAYEVKKKKTKDFKIIGEYSTIYVGLNSYQPLRASTFNAVFFIRRFAIALAVVFLQEAPVTQLLILVLGSLFTMLSYGYFRPFNENYNAWLEYLNEWSIMLTTVMCIAFTDLVPEVDIKNKVAWYLIIFFLFIMIKNICFGFYSFWFIYHRRVLGFDNKVAAITIVEDIKAPKTEVKMSINGNDHPVVDQEVGEVKDPYHNPYGMFQIKRPILGQNTYNVSSDGPSGWMSAHNDNENSSFSNQPQLLRPPDQTVIDVSQQEQMSVYDLYKLHTSTLKNLINPYEQDGEVSSFRQPLPNPNLQIEEEHWNNDFHIGVQDQQSENEEEEKVGQLHQVYQDKFVGTNQIQTRNAIHRKGLSEDFGSFRESGRSNGSLLIDNPLRPNQEINRKATQFQQNHAVNKPRFNQQQDRLDMSYEQSKHVKSSLQIFENPMRNSVETSFAVTPKANLQFYGRQNIDQASSNATIIQDPYKIASVARHRKVASFSDLSEPSARLNNIMMSRIERRQRNRVNGEQRQNTNSPPKVEKTYESDDEDFKQFELGLANRTENVRKSPKRIKDKGMPKLSDRNIKLEHDILSIASSELSRLGKK